MLEPDASSSADDDPVDRLQPFVAARSDASAEPSEEAVPSSADEPAIELEVEYDPSPRGAVFDREGHRAYLQLIYGESELADLEPLAWEVMQRANTLTAQAFKDQRARGLCNAAISTDGFTPKRLRERRPSCRFKSQLTTERAEVPGGEMALRHVEYYVREDEYPEVFRASEELRWLEERIKELGGKGPQAR
jgi:hypothetical protein